MTGLMYRNVNCKFDTNGERQKQNICKITEIKAFGDIGYCQMPFLFICDFVSVEKRRYARTLPMEIGTPLFWRNELSWSKSKMFWLQYS